MVHDFFTPQPVAADAYFFRMIFHDWSNKNCVRILRALVPVLRKGAKVLINDTVCQQSRELFPRTRSAR